MQLRIGLAVTATSLRLVLGQAFTSSAAEIYSKRMALSLMSRGQGIMTGTGGSSEPLQAGFTQKAFSALIALYPDETDEIRAYIRKSAASVEPFMLNATHNAYYYPLDRLSNGNALLPLSMDDTTNTFRAAADALYESIYLNRRNSEGGLWYYVYPEWSYLDGMYSLAPFYTLYSTTAAPGNGSNDTVDALDDMYYQLDLLWQHTYNETSGLLVHGYDASRTAVWAIGSPTGASPHVWGRSLGWFAMALVDALEVLPKSVTGRCYFQKILQMYRTLAPALIDAVDQETGGWWQVLDQPGKEGNYIESSGSAMFAYALLKGVRLGYLADELATRATDVAVRANGYLTSTFVVREANRTLGYNGTVAVCSLNSTASYEYYTTQPILYNSVLGSAAYILASLEVERLALV